MRSAIQTRHLPMGNSQETTPVSQLNSRFSPCPVWASCNSICIQGKQQRLLDFKAQPAAACSRTRADRAHSWARELPSVALHRGHQHTQSSLLLPLTATSAHLPGAATDQGQPGIQRVDSALLHVKIPLISPRKQARMGLFLTSVYFYSLSSIASHTAVKRAPGNYSAASLHPRQQGRALAPQPQVLLRGSEDIPCQQPAAPPLEMGPAGCTPVPAALPQDCQEGAAACSAHPAPRSRSAAGWQNGLGQSQRLLKKHPELCPMQSPVAGGWGRGSGCSQLPLTPPSPPGASSQGSSRLPRGKPQPCRRATLPAATGPPLPWQCCQGSDNIFLHPNFCRRFVSPARAPLDTAAQLASPGSGEGAWPRGCCAERAAGALRGARAWE